MEEDTTAKYDPLKDSPAYNSATRIEEAERFLKNIVWTYENVSERGTAPKDGRCNRMTIRRFAPGAPGSCVREVLDILTKQAPYSDPVINNMVFPGKWKPKMSWFRKDSAHETVNYKTQTVTLIQELVPADENGDVEDVAGGGNCTQIREIEYVWDATDVETPEPPYPQGVTYQVGGVNRDDDSGLFSYYIEKTIAVTQHYGPYVTQQTATSVVTQETWKNAYELPEGLPEDDGTYTIAGETVTVKREINPDCTWDITVLRERKVLGDTTKECKKVLTEHEDATTVSGSAYPIGEAPQAGDGKYYANASKKEEDGTYTNREQVTNEISVKNHTKSYENTLFGLKTTTVDKNQGSEPTGTPKIGESLSYQRTPGGSYDVTRVCFSVTNPGDVEESLSTTIAQSQCSWKSIKETKGTDTASAGNGVLTAYQYEQNQYGLWNTTKSVTTELPVIECAVSKDVTLQGTRVTTISKNQPSADGYSATEVGDSLSVVKTPGGLYDITKTSVDMSKEMDTAWSSGATAFVECHCETKIQSRPLSCTEGLGSATCAGEGLVNTAASRLTEYGAYENTTAVMCEINVDNAEETVQKTVFGTTTRKKHRSRDKKETATKAGVTVINTVTDGGLYDVDITTTERCRICWAIESQKSTFETRTKTDYCGLKSPVEIGGYGSADTTLNDDGSYSGSMTEVTPVPGTYMTSSRSQFHGSSTSTTTMHSGSALPSTGGYAAGSAVIQNVSRATDVGTWETTVTQESPGPAWKEEFFLPHKGGGTKFAFFGNYPSMYIPSYSGSILSASASVSRDSTFGLYNGHVQVTYGGSDSTSGGYPEEDECTGTSCSTDCDSSARTLGCAVVAEWNDSSSVETYTVEVYNGVGYVVTWKATMHTGFKKAGTAGLTLGLPGSILAMPGGPAGGVVPYADGVFYTVFSGLSRSNSTGDPDENGAPKSIKGGGSSGGSGS